MEVILGNIPQFMLIWLRVSAVITATPFFSNRSFIAPLKITLSFFLALLLVGVLPIQSWSIPATIPGFIFLAIGEMMVGLAIALTMFIIFFSLQLMGHFIGFQMSFTMAASFDPSFNEQTSLLASFFAMIAIMLFLALGGDHLLIRALSASFLLLPPGHIAVSSSFLQAMNALFMKSFVIGTRLAAPAIILLLLNDMTLGIMGKASSKMQVFFVGIPLKIAAGLIGISILMNMIPKVWGPEIKHLGETLARILGLLRH